MAGEVPGVEQYGVIDKYHAFKVVFERLRTYDFETALTEEAQERLVNEIAELSETMSEQTEHFVLQLHFDPAERQLNQPDDPTWCAIMYNYRMDDEGILRFLPGRYFRGGDAEIEELRQKAPDMPIYSFQWNDVNWNAGYSLLLKQPLADSLPSVN
ncbi:MAG: hypothetical protein ABIQ89_03495 [Candidatus Saccharimonadales bacterium]